MNPFAALGRFVVRFRWVILVVWLVGAPLAAKHMPSLSSVAKNDNSAFLPASAPSERAATLATPFQPKSKGTALLVAVRADGPLTGADERAIAAAATAVAGVHVVQAVRDEGTSADGHAQKVALLLDLPPFGGGDQATNAIDAIRHAMARTATPPGLALHLAGAIPTFVDEQKATGHMQGVTQELAIVFIIALLLVVFRAALAPLVTLFPAALALVLAGPLIAEATHIGVQVSSLLQLLLVVIVLGAGTDYGLFLIFRMREELRAGRDPKDAVVVSVTGVGESITFSGITVIAALASLLLASFGLYRGLGPGLAIGIAVVLVANLTLLPALLALIGRAVFWPFIPKPGPTAPQHLGCGRHPGGGSSAADARHRHGGVRGPRPGRLRLLPGRLRGAHGERHQRLGAGVRLRSPPTSPPPSPIPPTWFFASPTRRGSSWPSWPGPRRPSWPPASSAPWPVELDPDGRGGAFTLAQLSDLYRALGPPQSLPATGPPNSTVPPRIYGAYRATAQFVSADGRTLLYDTSLAAGAPETATALNAIPAVRGAVASVATRIGALDNGVAGEAPSLNDVASVSAHDLAKILPIVMIVLALLLALMLRSLVAPLYLVLSVALSYLAALGLAVLAFVIVGGQAGHQLRAALLHGHLHHGVGRGLQHPRHEPDQGRGPLPAAARGGAQGRAGHRHHRHLGRPHPGRDLRRAHGGGSTQVKEIGLGLAVGVLLDTFLVRTLLVPSTVVLIGRWNWWPSKLGHAEVAAVVEESPAREEPAPVS